jgi:ABC-2 type transport system ATP-binding protein
MPAWWQISPLQTSDPVGAGQRLPSAVEVDDREPGVAGPGAGGPLSKLAAENRELDYRVITSDPGEARRLAEQAEGVLVVDDAQPRHATEALVVRTLVPALDGLVVRLVQAGIALRELATVASPLEGAFLALTEQQEGSR